MFRLSVCHLQGDNSVTLLNYIHTVAIIDNRHVYGNPEHSIQVYKHAEKER